MVKASKNMRRPEAGDLPNSTMANRQTRRRLRHASPVMYRQKDLTSSSRTMRLKPGLVPPQRRCCGV
jgi:hypothetical protein